MKRLPSKGPNSPFSVGNRTLLARTCSRCGRFADGDSFPILNRGTKNETHRKTCHDCTNALKKQAREERGIGLPPATRPPEETQTRKRTRWSQEDDDYLREHLTTGEETYEEIALVLGRSLKAVYKRRDVLGISKVRLQHRVEKPWVVRQEEQ
jgi:hypothetical protein